MMRDASFYRNASHNLYVLHHLRSLLARLNSEGPEVLFFRGVSLLGDVYPSVGERGMLDVDILVREKDLRQLKEILKSIGLAEADPGVFERRGFVLDLHTTFLNPSRSILGNSCFTISLEDIFGRSISKRLDDMELKIPCPEHLFISTAIHLQSHSFCWEKGWEDLIRIKRHYGLSNEDILSEARRMGMEKNLSYLGNLRPDHFPSWEGNLSFGERWVLKRIKGGNFNQNFGDLLFLLQSRQRVKALKEIFFPHGVSLRIIGDRLWKCLLLLKDTLT